MDKHWREDNVLVKVVRENIVEEVNKLALENLGELTINELVEVSGSHVNRHDCIKLPNGQRLSKIFNSSKVYLGCVINIPTLPYRIEVVGDVSHTVILRHNKDNSEPATLLLWRSYQY